MSGRRRSAMVRALDAWERPVVGPRALCPPVRAPQRREMSVVAALHWAFAVERVSLEFDDIGAERAGGVDTIARLMQRGVLGCKIDGGGVSARHEDAEVIASVLAALPAAVGGRGMAVWVASLARVQAMPDAMVGERVRCVPVGWVINQHGTRARTEVLREVVTVERGRRVVRPEVWCPVTYAPSAQQIGAARRGWLDWWGAILHLQRDLSRCGLRSITLTPEMPPLTPWRDGD